MGIKPRRVEGFVEIAQAPIIFKNFSGRERPPYNPEGYRNFCVVINDQKLADQMSNDGWNIKVRKPRDDEGDPILYLPVKISYNVRPPQVAMITADGKRTEFKHEEDLDALDAADIRYGNVAVNPYNWEMNGNHGVTAYLKYGDFFLEKVPFSDMYEEEFQTPEQFD